jgi:murein L,D-transpeptidase YafK
MARILGILALILVISGTTALAKTIPKYDGEPVTAIVVHKEARKMFLMHNDTVLRSYNIGLGFAPDGHKKIEGDGKTP